MVADVADKRRRCALLLGARILCRSSGRRGVSECVDGGSRRWHNNIVFVLRDAYLGCGRRRRRRRRLSGDQPCTGGVRMHASTRGRL